MVSAVDRVLGTTELLENILLLLPLRDHLLAKRISTRFRDVMNESSMVRKALFVESLWEASDTENIKMAAYQPPPSNFQYLPTDMARYMVLNPFFDKFFRSEECSIRISRGFPNLRSIMVMGPLANSPPHASWRRMFLLQRNATPAVCTFGMDLRFTEYYPTRGPPHEGEHEISLLNGLQMTRVVDLEAASRDKRINIHLDAGLTILRGPYKLQPGVLHPVDYELKGKCGWSLLIPCRHWDIHQLWVDL